MTKQAKMSQPVYGNINADGSWDMNRHTERNQTHQHTGSDSVRNRRSRAAAVCLGLLCVLVLTAVIVLCVHIHTLSTNYTEERNTLLNKITNLTEERDGLKFTNKNLTNERDQIILTNKNLTNERDQIILTNNNLTKERDQLRNELQICDEWTFYQSSFYFISSEKKSWTESRRYCTERGADLIIINNKEEQDFLKNISDGTSVYIGLTDRDVEGTWKWADGSSLNSGFSFWASGEPNGQTSENCVLAVDHDQKWPHLLGWIDNPCDRAFQWICEKNISHLILP